MKKLFNISILMWVTLLKCRAQEGIELVKGAIGFNYAYRQAYRSTNGFSANVQITIPDPKEPIVETIRLEQNDLFLRADFNLRSLKSIPPAKQEAMSACGLNEMILLHDLVRTNSAIVFPKAKCFVVVAPNSDICRFREEADGSKQENKEICTKRVGGKILRQVLHAEPGSTGCALVWEQEDLNNFPVSIDAGSSGKTILFVTKSVDLQRPTRERFAIPKNYTLYPDISSLRTAIVGRFLQEKALNDKQ
ncbi:MAG TPA: hypothetical protein VMF06_12785 [Candidatus Limnocylindria bacterium]|nr:hypothetical protein [Candidatus Limnocylindria bacterium]